MDYVLEDGDYGDLGFATRSRSFAGMLRQGDLPGMTHPRRRLRAATASLVATLAAACGGSQASEDGPLVEGNDHGSSVTLPVGAQFTDGFEILRLGGGDDAVIESVDIEGDPGIEMLGAKVVGPDRNVAALQMIEGWPPTDPELEGATVVDAEGATITPKAQDPIGWELLIGLRVTRPGYLVREAVIVTYTVDGERFRARLPGQIAICAGPEYEKRADCPFSE